MTVTKMFMLLQAMIWANSCSANEITDENKSTLMSRLVKKVQSRSINDTKSGRSLNPCQACCDGTDAGACLNACAGCPTTGAPTQAYDFRIQRAKGRSCRLGYAVPTVEECKGAAASYGLSYKRSFYSNDRPQGCWIKNTDVFWNTITGMRSHRKVWGKSKAICINEFGTWKPTFKYEMAGLGGMKRNNGPWGLNCPNSRMIQNEMNCKNACVEMGLGYKKKVNSKWRPGGCMARKSRCYFNENLVSPLAKFRNKQGICKAFNPI